MATWPTPWELPLREVQNCYQWLAGIASQWVLSCEALSKWGLPGVPAQPPGFSLFPRVMYRGLTSHCAGAAAPSARKPESLKLLGRHLCLSGCSAEISPSSVCQTEGPGGVVSQKGLLTQGLQRSIGEAWFPVVTHSLTASLGKGGSPGSLWQFDYNVSWWRLFWVKPDWRYLSFIDLDVHISLQI